MNRIEFIRSRMDTWCALQDATKKLGRRLGGARAHSEALQEFIRNYRRTISDLSLLRSMFPGDPLIHDLNALVCRAGLLVSSNQHSDRARIARFYTQTLPRVMVRLLPMFWVSLTIFGSASLFGFFISLVNIHAPNAILGDDYVVMTLENIRDGTPFAVYQSKFKYAMSSFIMANNIRVAFTAFAVGVFYGVGTFFVLVSNGLMLGSVAAVFAHHDLLMPFTATVMIHGALELFAVVVAGAAGLRFGQSIFRPGPVSRMQALAAFGIEAFHVTLAMVPVFIVAGILEGYVTPLPLEPPTQYMIIAATVAFLTLYLGIPFILGHRRNRQRNPHQPDIVTKH